MITEFKADVHTDQNHAMIHTDSLRDYLQMATSPPYGQVTFPKKLAITIPVKNELLEHQVIVFDDRTWVKWEECVDVVRELKKRGVCLQGYTKLKMNYIAGNIPGEKAIPAYLASYSFS